MQSEFDVKDYKQTESQRRVGFTQPSTLKMEDKSRGNIKERGINVDQRGGVTSNH